MAVDYDPILLNMVTESIELIRQARDCNDEVKFREDIREKLVKGERDNRVYDESYQRARFHTGDFHTISL